MSKPIAKGGRITIPHGTIGLQDIGDPKIREKLMKFNENIIALEARITALEAVNKTNG